MKGKIYIIRSHLTVDVYYGSTTQNIYVIDLLVIIEIINLIWIKIIVIQHHLI